MTNVEAIEVLIHECPTSPRKPYGFMKKIAFLMAIDALSDKRRKDIENAVIDRVLEIIDKAQTYKMEVGSTDLYVDREALREAVLTLKGGES